MKEGSYRFTDVFKLGWPKSLHLPRLSPRGPEVLACFWGCYYRAALGLLGLICPELRSDWRSRGDAEDAARSLSNRLRCWSTKWRIVCISACLIGSDTSYSCCLMYVMTVHRQWWCVQLKQGLNWDLQLNNEPGTEQCECTSFLSGLVRWIQTNHQTTMQGPINMNNCRLDWLKTPNEWHFISSNRRLHGLLESEKIISMYSWLILILCSYWTDFS